MNVSKPISAFLKIFRALFGTSTSASEPDRTELFKQEIDRNMIEAIEVRKILQSQRGMASFLGGAPRLPRELKWPKDSAGRPIPFIGQIDFSSLPPIDGQQLPASGVAFFFLDTELNEVGNMSASVLFSESLGDEPAAIPDNLPAVGREDRESGRYLAGPLGYNYLTKYHDAEPKIYLLPMYFLEFALTKSLAPFDFSSPIYTQFPDFFDHYMQADNATRLPVAPELTPDDLNVPNAVFTPDGIVVHDFTGWPWSWNIIDAILYRYDLIERTPDGNSSFDMVAWLNRSDAADHAIPVNEKDALSFANDLLTDFNNRITNENFQKLASDDPEKYAQRINTDIGYWRKSLANATFRAFPFLLSRNVANTSPLPRAISHDTNNW